MLLSSTHKDWLGNVRGNVLAGIVVALALIPEVIAFSIIAGVVTRFRREGTNVEIRGMNEATPR